MIKNLLLWGTIFLAVCSCSHISEPQITPQHQTNQQSRSTMLADLQSWNIQGKIAFITPKKRESANIVWKVKNNKTQELNLSTYFGITLFQLKEVQGLYELSLNDEKFKSDDINELMLHISGTELPAKALVYWIKGLKHHSSDNIFHHEKTGLPQSLTSQFNHQEWQIDYQSYTSFSGKTLPKKLTLKQKNTLIKLVINDWTSQ